jgi:hypothetical protein
VSAPVHVSIHDVSPAFADEVRQALAMCHARGITPALLVVPNFHGTAPLVQDASFCAELRALQASGHEVFLHGFYHRSTEAEREAMLARGVGGRAATFVSQKLVSQNEAECSLLTTEELERRIGFGEAVLEEAGLRIEGFVPPAWGLQPDLEGILARRGYRYLEERLAIVDPVARVRRRSLVLNFASRTPERILSTTAFCRGARPLAALAPTRIALHPKDLHVRLLRHETESLLDWARDRRVVRAPELFAA